MTADVALEARQAVDEWIDSALIEVALTGGGAVRVKPGSVMDLVIADALPMPITAAVVDTAGPGGSGLGADATESLDVIRQTVKMAAASIRRIRRGGDWLPVTIDVETFLALPMVDRGQIAKVALGEELAEVVSGLATFRNVAAGDDAGQDGADVRPEAVGPRRDRRRAARARS